jgi:hypothetical protein
MPHTTSKAASLIRAGFTGEDAATALPGIDRFGGLGLDHCTPEQIELRAMLALACFNHGTLTAPRLRWRVGQIGAYGPVVSPRLRLWKWCSGLDLIRGFVPASGLVPA